MNFKKGVKLKVLVDFCQLFNLTLYKLKKSGLNSPLL